MIHEGHEGDLGNYGLALLQRARAIFAELGLAVWVQQADKQIAQAQSARGGLLGRLWGWLGRG